MTYSELGPKFADTTVLRRCSSVFPAAQPNDSGSQVVNSIWYGTCSNTGASGTAGAFMGVGFEHSTIRCDGIHAAPIGSDGSLAWYKVVGIEFFLFAAILAPVVCGALLAR